jgi:hypothetical protein
LRAKLQQQVLEKMTKITHSAAAAAAAAADIVIQSIH